VPRTSTRISVDLVLRPSVTSTRIVRLPVAMFAGALIVHGATDAEPLGTPSM